MNRSWLHVSTALAAGALALAGPGCDLPKTLTPDVQLTTSLPLLDEEIQIGDRVTRANSVRVNPGDPEEFQLHFERDTVELGENGRVGGDRMAVPDQVPQFVSDSVGSIKLDDQPPTSTPSVTLEELIPALKTMPDSAMPFRLLRTRLPTSKEPISFENIRRVTFVDASSPDTNRIVFSFANHLPLPLGPVEVYLSTSGDTVATTDGSPGVVKDVVQQVVIERIMPGDSVVAEPIDLAGKTLTSPSYVITRAEIQGGEATANQLKDGYFVATVDISALVVASANAKIPRQSFGFEKSISFENQKLQLINVDLTGNSRADTNRFALNLRNQLPTDVVVRYSLPDLTIPRPPVTGASLLSDVKSGTGGPNYAEATLDIAAKSNKLIVFDLAGTNLGSSVSRGKPMDQLQIGVVTTIKSTDEFVDIMSSDSVRVDADMSALAIRRVDGRIPDGDPLRVQIKPFRFEVTQDVPSGLEAFHAQEIAVDLLIAAYDVTVTADADIKLTVFAQDDVTPLMGYRRVISREIRDGTKIRFALTQDSIGADGHSPTQVINATLDNIFGHGRSAMEFSGEITVRGDVMLVRDLSRLEVSDVTVDSPLKFTVPAVTFDGTEGDKDPGYEVDVGQSVRDDIVPRSDSLTLVADVENHFPVGGTLVMFASSDSTFSALRTQYPAAQKTLVSQIPEMIAVPPESVTGTKAEVIAKEDSAVHHRVVFKLFTITMPEPGRLSDGTVDDANPGRADVTVALRDEIKLFGYEHLYLLPRVQLLDEPGLVQLTPQDYVKIAVWAQFSGTTKRKEQ